MDTLQAVVKSVFTEKRYVLCKLLQPRPGSKSRDNEVTFNLSNWTGESVPRKGQIALLSGVERYENGWRASKASPETLGLAASNPEQANIGSQTK